MQANGRLQTTGFKKDRIHTFPLLRPGGALEPLLWPCGGFCMREWRVLGLLGYLLPAKLGVLHAGVCGAGRTFGGFGAFGKRPARHFKRFKGLKAGKRQA